MTKWLSIYFPAVAFLATVFLLVYFADSVTALAGLISGMNAVSYVAYVLILMTAVVAMPVTVMPIIPVAAALFGPFTTAILSVIGWTLGGVVAFLIARHLGRPVLERFVSLEKVDQLTARIPQDTRFLFIILLRLTIPVDIVSYALGLSKTVGFLEYTAATFIGVIWFSFAFAYLGDALLSKNTFLLIEVGAASLMVFILAWFFLGRKTRQKG